MRSRYAIVESNGIYFLTATIIEWIPTLVGKETYDVVIDALDFCRKNKGLRVYAYVIMENHVHLVRAFINTLTHSIDLECGSLLPPCQRQALRVGRKLAHQAQSASKLAHSIRHRISENVYLVAEAPDLSGVIQSFKRHTAKEIIELAGRMNKAWLLNQFEYFRKRHKQTSQHQVWQEGVHPQLIQSDDTLRQKIAYIHDNPVRRGYVNAPEDWRCSSVRNYVLDDHSVLEIDAIPL